MGAGFFNKGLEGIVVFSDAAVKSIGMDNRFLDSGYLRLLSFAGCRVSVPSSRPAGGRKRAENPLGTCRNRYKVSISLAHWGD